MRKIIDLFYKIKNTSSMIDKINLIKANKDNENFIDDLIFLLKPDIITGISTKSLMKDIDKVKRVDIDDELEEWKKLKALLLSNPTTNKNNILACQKFIVSVPEKNREYYEQMITRKFKIGCDCRSLNKAIPGLIFVYETQQAFPINDRNKPKDGEWFSLSEKLNGINGGFINGKCLSRQGKEICGMDHIAKDLDKLGLSNYYVNGELIRNNVDGLPDEENFRLTTSIVNSDAPRKPEIIFIFYEVIPRIEFYNGISRRTYRSRLMKYRQLKEEIEKLGIKNVRFVDHYYSGFDQTKIDKWLAYADSHNKEGIMLNKDTFWMNKRNVGILKVKSFKNCDVVCTGVEEGDGKYSGMLGRINCDYKGFNLGVGTGFNDDQRKYYWEHPEEIIGKLVTVKYKTVTKNSDGGESLQFPVFIAIRKDKDEVSYED